MLTQSFMVLAADGDGDAFADEVGVGLAEGDGEGEGGAVVGAGDTVGAGVGRGPVDSQPLRISPDIKQITVTTKKNFFIFTYLRSTPLVTMVTKRNYTPELCHCSIF
jgi:hypothetical protein